MKKLFLAVIFTAFISLACACNGTSTENGESSDSIAGIKIGVLRTADSLPVYVADALDLFKDNGVDVELVEFSSASDQSKAMEAGAIDAMMTDMVVQNLISKGGTKLKTITTALGADPTEGKFLVVSYPDSSITSLDDVSGKSVAISEGTMMEYLVDSYFKELGIDINSVEKVNIPSLSLR
ncbi:MAG: ABC transporter substrate-binding protein, partial [Parasporobacterium sp.]|nr:ABC transporter substrate-binding protein [Parasporobacterium sp.]